jgi:hypothetical protein
VDVSSRHHSPVVVRGAKLAPQAIKRSVSLPTLRSNSIIVKTTKYIAASSGVTIGQPVRARRNSSNGSFDEADCATYPTPCLASAIADCSSRLRSSGVMK